MNQKKYLKLVFLSSFLFLPKMLAFTGLILQISIDTILICILRQIWHDYPQRSEIWDQVVIWCRAQRRRYAAFKRTWRGRRSFRNLIMHGWVLGIQFKEMKHFQLQRKHTSKWPMLRPLGCFKIQVSVSWNRTPVSQFFCNPSFVLNWSKMLTAEFHFEFQWTS